MSERYVEVSISQIKNWTEKIAFLESERKAHRWMMNYAMGAPDFDAAKSILKDALNGVRGGENCEEIRSEVEHLESERDRLRKGLEYIGSANIIHDSALWMRDVARTALESSQPEVAGLNLLPGREVYLRQLEGREVTVEEIKDEIIKYTAEALIKKKHFPIDYVATRLLEVFDIRKREG